MSVPIIEDLSEEEIGMIITRRKGIERDSIAPVGIGISRTWAKAKLKKKKFLDEVTFVEKEGRNI